ncbi:MAG: YybS family protein [Desulfuromonadales bacterium]|nr:YybS family protein [Desulfuromonadales bacterium]
MNLSDKAGHVLGSRISAVLIGMAGSFILFAAYLVIPPAGIFSGLLAPFPAAYVRLRHGRGSAVIIILGATAAMTAYFGLSAGAFYLVQCGLIALLLPELLLRGFSAVRSIAWTTAAIAALLSVAVVIFSMAGGQNVHQMAVAEIQKSVAQAVAIYEKSGVQGEELAVLKQTMSTAADLVIRMYPALIIITLIGMAGCNLWLLRRFAAGMGYHLNISEFREYRNPDLLVWGLIAAGSALLMPDGLITTVALNALVIIVVLYFLQGLAVLSTVIARQSIAGVLRAGLYVMLLLQPYLAALVAAIGIFDLWGDFRTPRKQENL